MVRKKIEIFFWRLKSKEVYRKKVQILNPSIVHIKDMCVSQGYINRCTDCKIANKLVLDSSRFDSRGDILPP